MSLGQIVISLKAETAHLKAGLAQAQKDIAAVKAAAGGMGTTMTGLGTATESTGRKFGLAARQFSFAGEQMARTGQIAGGGLRMMIASGAEMAFMFGTTGPVIGALAITAVSIGTYFANARKEIEETVLKAREAAKSLSKMGVSDAGEEARRLFSGDPLSTAKDPTTRRAEEIGVGGLRAQKASLEATVESLRKVADETKRTPVGLIQAERALLEIDRLLKDIEPRYAKVFGQFQKAAASEGARMANLARITAPRAQGAGTGGFTGAPSDGGWFGDVNIPNIPAQRFFDGGKTGKGAVWDMPGGGGGMLGKIGGAGKDIFSSLAGGLMGAFDPVTLGLKLLGPAIETLTPLFEALQPVLKIVTDAVSVLGQIVATVSGWIYKAIGGLLTGIGKLLNMLPGSIGNPLIRAGQWMTNFGQGLTDAADEMKKARSAQAGLTETVAQLNAELRNAPSSFNYARAYRGAVAGAAAIGAIGGGTMPSGGNWPGRGGSRKDEGFANYGTVIIQTPSVDAAFIQSLGVHVQRSGNRGGTTRTRRGIAER